MMTPLCRVTAGGDQEKFTCLCPATATNISGTPAGTENSKSMKMLPLLTHIQPTIFTTFSGTRGQSLWQ